MSIKKNSTLLLYFSWPPQAPIHGKTKWTKIDCFSSDTEVRYADDSTTAVNEGKQLLGNNLFAFAQKGDFFTGICADKNCLTIDKKCRLFKRIE
jgi:hypothetical protein